MRTIDWNDASSSIAMIDQTLLPVECKVIECKTLSSLCEAIVSLRIRGGATGPWRRRSGIALAATLSNEGTMDALIKELETTARTIKATRPTAVNLGWGVAA